MLLNNGWNSELNTAKKLEVNPGSCEICDKHPNLVWQLCLNHLKAVQLKD